MLTIDLTEEQRGYICLCCEGAVAELVDREIGPVCGDCFVPLLRVQQQLRIIWPDQIAQSVNAK